MTEYENNKLDRKYQRQAKKFKIGEKVYVVTTFGKELERVLDGLAPKRVVTIKEKRGESMLMEELKPVGTRLSFHVSHLKTAVIPEVNRFQLMDMD